MKVGIITLSLENNYGGILQNFALQHVLKEMGHTPKTCRWTAYTRLGFYKAVLLWILKGGKDTFPTTPSIYNKNRKGLEDFIKTHINYRYYRNPKRFLKHFKPEAMIVGSDQVWRPKYNSHLYAAYLDFTQGYTMKRLAYAASFGVDEWEYTNEQEQCCRELISKFDAVSVREESGVKLCKEHFGVEAKWVVDPTLLVRRFVYEELCSIISKEEPFILVYMLDFSEQVKSAAKKLSTFTGLPVWIMKANKGVKPNDSVEKWIAAFRDARYVITDSFHGTIFSIIFETEFFCVGNKNRGMARFESLLSHFGLGDRMVTPQSIGLINQYTSIDWDRVNKVRMQLHEDSIRFIQNNLNIII